MKGEVNDDRVMVRNAPLYAPIEFPERATEMWGKAIRLIFRIRIGNRWRLDEEPI